MDGMHDNRMKRMSPPGRQVFKSIRLCCCVLAGWGVAGCRSLPGRPEYEVKVKGAANRAMVRDVRALSDAHTYREVPVSSAEALERRIHRDAETIRRYLRSRGYYGAHVETRVEEERGILTVYFDIGRLRLFHVSDYEVILTPPPPEETTIPSRIVGRPATFSEIRDEGRRLRRLVRSAGYPLAEVTSRQVTAYHDRNEVLVRYKIDTGPPAHFGVLDIVNLGNVNETFVRNLQPWDEGDAYSIEVVDEYRRRLAGSGLFSVMEFSGPPEVEADGSYPMTLRLHELRRQAVRAGLEYRTDEGFELAAGWVFRNLTGRGDRLEFSAVLARDHTLGEIALRVPQVRHPRQSLLWNLSAEEEDRPAYESRSYRSSVHLEREWSRYVTTRAGLALRLSEIDETWRKEEYWLASIPAQLVWNRRDEAVNPTRGYYLRGRLEPFADLEREGESFVKARADLTYYHRLRRDARLLLAGRGAIGSAMGTGLSSVPADERYYAGGSRSIRGYPYQEVGPIYEGKPTGGRSLLEVSLEMRGRWRDYGAVLFMDGGQVYEDVLVDVADTLVWGTGFGVRYFTALGPIRADAGIPLNPPSHVSKRIQYYLSIGQAF